VRQRAEVRDQRAADGEQRESEREKLQRQPAMRDPERDARCRLAGARDGPRQQQAGDVGAGDDEQQAGGGEQQQRRTDLADAALAQVDDPGGVRRMCGRTGGGDLRGVARDVLFRLPQRDSRFSPRVAEIKGRVGVRPSAERIEVGPDVGVEALAAGTPARGGRTPAASRR